MADGAAGLADALRRRAPSWPRPVRDALIVYVLNPMFLGLIWGWTRAGRAHDWPLELALGYWLPAAFVGWIAVDVSTRAAQLLLRPWHPGLLVTLIVGGIAAIPVAQPVMSGFIAVFHGLFVPEALRRPLPELSLTAVIDDHVISIVMWVALNLAFVHLFAIPRFGFAAAGREPLAPRMPAPPIASDAQPAFMQRVRRPIGRLMAVSAEQHYLRVIGEAGDELILYRISDAIRELAPLREGVQVHRSHWVAKDAVIDVERGENGIALKLGNGTRIPVSRSYRAGAAEAGLLAKPGAVRAA